ncbi:MAG: UbiA family prenyltransferase [Nocardioidaceae bacterium]
MPDRAALKGLALACHPGPAVAVTAFACVLAVAVGAGADLTVLVAVTFLVGQLSVGWSNDWIDAARDVAVGRTDKPVAAGSVTRTTVGSAALVAAALTIPLSLLLGLAAGLVHLAAVASAWSYNLGLKNSVWSWAPYAFSFGALPVIVTLALPGHPMPRFWVPCASALLGVGAHVVNVLPDLREDRATGISGLPHRLGPGRSTLLASGLLVIASLVVVLGPGTAPGPVRWVALVVIILIAGVSAVSANVPGPRGRWALLGTVAVVLADVALLVTSGSSLVTG